LTEENDGVVHLPIDGVLDLHTFNPKEAAAVVDEYLGACLDKDIYEVRSRLPPMSVIRNCHRYIF